MQRALLRGGRQGHRSALPLQPLLPGERRSALLPRPPTCSQGPFATPLHPLAFSRNTLEPKPGRERLLVRPLPDSCSFIDPYSQKETICDNRLDGNDAQIAPFAKPWPNGWLGDMNGPLQTYTYLSKGVPAYIMCLSASHPSCILSFQIF
jgi:hypothetical protein